MTKPILLLLLALTLCGCCKDYRHGYHNGWSEGYLRGWELRGNELENQKK